MGGMNIMKRRKLHTVLVLLVVLVCIASCCTKCEAKRSRGSSRSSSRGSTSIFQRNSNRKGSSKEPSVQHPAQDGVVAPNSKGVILAKPKSTADAAKKIDNTKPVNQPAAIKHDAAKQQAAAPPYSGAPPAYNPAYPAPGGAPPAYPGQQPIGWNVPNSGSNHQLHSQRTVGNTQSGYPQQPHGAPPAYSPGAYPPAYSPHAPYPNQGMQGGYPHQTPYGGYQGGGYNQMQPGGYGGYGGHHGGGYGGYGGGGMIGGFGGMGGYGGFGALPYERKRGFGSGFGGTMVKVAAGMLVWNMVSNALMPSKRYHVHNYYNNPETVPQQITLPANVITLCEGPSKELCISGTIPLCTQNGTIMCVTTMTNTVPCKENAGNCLSTVDSVPNKDGNEKTSPSEALNLPCIANATVNNLDGLDLNKQQTSTTVNATINLFDGANTQTIFCVTTLAIPAPDELPGENGILPLPCGPDTENTTICENGTNTMPIMPPGMIAPPPSGYPMGPIPENQTNLQHPPMPPPPGYYYGPYGPYGYYGAYGYPYQWPPPPNMPQGPPIIPLEGEPGATTMYSATDETGPPNQESLQNMEVMDQPINSPIERVPMNIPIIPKEIHHHVEDAKITPSPVGPSTETE